MMGASNESSDNKIDQQNTFQVHGLLHCLALWLFGFLKHKMRTCLLLGWQQSSLQTSEETSNQLVYRCCGCANDEASESLKRTRAKMLTSLCPHCLYNVHFRFCLFRNPKGNFKYSFLFEGFYTHEGRVL